MKKLFTLIIGIAFSIAIVCAQEAPPQAFSFKALITKNGIAVANKMVYLQISILQANLTGLAVYEEKFSPTTNEYGQVDLEIGRGTIVSGDFSTIEWSEDEYFLKIEYRLKSKDAYQTLSTTQLLSVPYALYSGEAGNGFASVYTEGEIRPILNAEGNISLGGPIVWDWKLDVNGQAIFRGPSNAEGGFTVSNGLNVQPGNIYYGSQILLDASSQSGGLLYLIASLSDESGEGPGKFLIRNLSESSILIMDNDGRVGIGNYSPEYKLDVLGDINFTGTLRKNGMPYSEYNTTPNGSNVGDMLYWNESTWAVLPAGTAGQVLTMSASGQPVWQNLEENPTPADGLLAYYPFSGNAQDESENGHQGIVNGAILTTDRFGNENKAYSFDGINDFIDIGDWTWGGAATICGWINYSELRWFSRFVDFGSGADSYNVIIHNLERSATCAVDLHRGSEIRRVSYDNFYDLGEWIFVTFTVTSDGKMKLYKNSVLAASIENGWEIDTALRTEQFIAKSNYGQDEYFKGKIDDVRIYNRVLTEAEISALYHEGGY